MSLSVRSVNKRKTTRRSENWFLCILETSTTPQASVSPQNVKVVVNFAKFYNRVGTRTQISKHQFFHMNSGLKRFLNANKAPLKVRAPCLKVRV